MTEIENLKTTIVTLQQQLEKLEAEQKAKKWEPKAGKFRTTTSGAVLEAYNSDADISYGGERDTEEAAVERFKEMRRFSRLLAYRDEFAPGYKFVKNQANYAVAFNVEREQWTAAPFYCTQFGAAVWFPRYVAKAIVEKLNSGEVEL
jgi:hypothetical protein